MFKQDERPITVRTGREIIILLMAVCAVASVAGRCSPTLDVLNSFAPMLLAIALATALSVAAHGISASGKLRLLVLLAAMITFGSRVFPELMTSQQSLSAQATVTIVTHNVSVRNRDPEATAYALLASGADVLLLQETDGRFAPLLRVLRQRFRYATPCKRGVCSMAILSRWPIVSSQYRVRNDDGREIGPALIVARIKPASAPVFDVVTLHLPWPLPARRHAKLRRQLAQVLPRLDQEGLVLAGDLNLTPWSFAMRDMDAAMHPLTRVSRAVASFPARFPSGQPAPWPLLPIDHVFIGRAWTPSSVELLPRTGSDHYPLRVSLALQRKIRPPSRRLM